VSADPNTANSAAFDATLSSSVRAIQAAQIATCGSGGVRVGPRFVRGSRDRGPTQADVASNAGIGQRTLRDALFIMRHGTPALVEAVRGGRMTLQAARRAVQPKDQAMFAKPCITDLLAAEAHRTAADLPDCCGRQGYTYLVGVPGMVKIGSAGNLAERLRDIQAMTPHRLGILAVARDREFERVLHKRFASCRSHGEWFVDETVKRWLELVSGVAAAAGVCIRCASGGDA
jgi:hypothetical protein